MKIRFGHLVFLVLIVGVVSLAYGLDYEWLTDSETAVFGDRLSWGFNPAYGDVRSNDILRCLTGSVFYGQFISSGYDNTCPGGVFYGPPPHYNAPELPFPNRLDQIRYGGNYINPGPGRQILCKFDGNIAHLYRWNLGEPFDSTDTWNMTLPTTVFFDCPLHVKGVVSSHVILGCSHDILIDDNVYYPEINLITGQPSGIVPASHLLTLASEGDIKIVNTPQNGRENSAGLGNNQTDQNLTSVVISAAIYAINGSFTFEQQNDVDSGYVCPCQPDDRGAIMVYGGIVQRQRGYLHRSNRASTGYLKQLIWDARLANEPEIIMPSLFSAGSTDSIDFHSVPVGTTVWDTADVYLLHPSALVTIHATAPFFADHGDTTFGSEFHIPVSFTPSQATPVSGVLTIGTSWGTHSVSLIGRGLHASDADQPSITLQPSSLALSASPNPFNSSMEIRYSLPQDSRVLMTIFDVLGREVRHFAFSQQASGEHRFAIHPADLTSGMYFIHLVAAGKQVTAKILLIR